MIRTIYVERAVRELPRTVDMLRRFPESTVVTCERYGELFNRSAQSFTLQKRRPALILAEKRGARVLPAPEGYGIGGQRNFYFSHMLNCLYDCRYCFLQGMYRSANYVVFVNYEDFQRGITEALGAARGPAWFFSGYDCDSLAFDRVSGFAGAFVPFFRDLEGASLELRTKSVQIGSLLEHRPFDRCVTAFSFTPQELSSSLEPGVPTVERRLAAMVKLQRAGWLVGLRFDPLLFCQGYEELYRRLFADVFRTLELARRALGQSGQLPAATAVLQASRSAPSERAAAGVAVPGAGRAGQLSR